MKYSIVPTKKSLILFFFSRMTKTFFFLFVVRWRVRRVFLHLLRINMVKWVFLFLAHLVFVWAEEGEVWPSSL